ncbi:MAG: Fe-S cluster assembly protein IscX [Pseudomonadota bacterium]
MKWTDTQEIAMQLADAYPDVDPRNINFVDLRQWVMDLPEFDDDPNRSGERILEAIQLAWIDEADVDD